MVTRKSLSKCHSGQTRIVRPTAASPRCRPRTVENEAFTPSLPGSANRLSHTPLRSAPNQRASAMPAALEDSIRPRLQIFTATA